MNFSKMPWIVAVFCHLLSSCFFKQSCCDFGHPHVLCHKSKLVIDYNRMLKGCYADFNLLPVDIISVPPRKLYLIKELLRAAIASFILTVAYETGIETFIRSHPHARGDLHDRLLIPGGVVVP